MSPFESRDWPPFYLEDEAAHFDQISHLSRFSRRDSTIQPKYSKFCGAGLLADNSRASKRLASFFVRKNCRIPPLFTADTPSYASPEGELEEKRGEKKGIPLFLTFPPTVLSPLPPVPKSVTRKKRLFLLCVACGVREE